MRRIIVGAIMAAIWMSACATTPVVLPEKYNLDNRLESVGSISVQIVRDFENVDNQSIILEADRHEYYLLVLRKPIDVAHSNLTIDIESTVSKDQAHSTQAIIGPKSTAGTAPNTEFVQGPSKITRIVSGMDRIIIVENSAEREYYTIEKVYKLKDRDQAEEIKEWLRRN